MTLVKHTVRRDEPAVWQLNILCWRRFLLLVLVNKATLCSIRSGCEWRLLPGIKELENEIMETIGQYPELMSAMKDYNENSGFEKVFNFDNLIKSREPTLYH